MPGRIVFSDVDGTLLNSAHAIAPRTRAAIAALQEKGNLFVLVSARSPACLYPILEENALRCPLIACNGALTLDEKRNVLRDERMPAAQAQALIERLERAGADAAWCAYTATRWLVRDRRDARIRREEEIVRALSEEGTVAELADGVNKILLICGEEAQPAIEAALRREFPQLSIAASSGTLLEVSPAGVTKAGAVRAFCASHGTAPSEALAFGDNWNDLPMLEAVGRGYLMDNAPVALRARIPLRTLDNDHDGIAAALEKEGLL